MTAVGVTIREKRSRFRDFVLIENALARIVRRRWPSNTVDNVAAEWSLPAGRARNVVYARTSMATLNLIVRHKRGGWPIIIAIFEQVIKTSLRDFVSREVVTLNETLRLAEREADRLAKLESDLGRLAALDLVRVAPRRVPRPASTSSASSSNDRASMGGAGTD